MRKIVLICSILLLVPLAAAQAKTQDAADKQPASAAPAGPVHYYHFDFIVEDLDSAGKVVNSRSYSTTVDTEPHYLTSIRTGSRIPVITGNIAGQTQYQYVDVGVDLDVRDVHEAGSNLAFDLTANLSGEASAKEATDTMLAHQPVIRQNKWQSRVIIPIGKRTVVFTSDSLDSKGSTRVVVTARSIEE
ncbi:MAG TPA: hypothetical protein VGR47_21245 [Terracidiphilus sp.]|nr:hypothetical protein [Terracidiphilus sp.]